MPIKAANRFRAKIIVTALSCDIFSDRPPKNIIIKFSLCVIPVAKITRIFKSDDETNSSNYRLISLLSNFNKIFEKLICNRMTRFLNLHSILFSFTVGLLCRVPEVFSCVWRGALSAACRRHKDLTETGNRTWKASGTQGTVGLSWGSFCPSCCHWYCWSRSEKHGSTFVHLWYLYWS